MLHLYDKYYLTTDKMNYILAERSIVQVGKNKGSETFTNIGYYGTNLNLLFNRLVDLKVHENIENVGFEQLLSTVKEIIELKLKTGVVPLKSR